jgi:amino-acid N-acetyltransferase
VPYGENSMKETFREKTDSIREVFLYLRKFQNRSFVIKIDYPLTVSPVFPSLIRDLAQLREVGIRILIVPGARERIDEILDLYGVENSMGESVRISSSDAMPFIKMAAFDVANRIMTLLTGNGMSAVIGNWVRARTLGVVDGIDYMSTGKVERIHTDKLNDLLDDNVIPIFPCIGWSSTGEPYNVSSNELSSVLAQAVSADKLFFVSQKSRDWPSRLTIEEVDGFLDAGGTKDHESYELLRSARDTCQGGVNRVHIVDGTLDGVILQEVFSNLGAGTMVYNNQYDRIRGVKPDEIPEILRLMEPWVQASHLVRRTHEDLLAKLQHLHVFEVDGALHGCAGLIPFAGGQAEIAGLAVDQQFAELGIGRRLVEFLIDKARADGYRELFLLTTQAFDWFRQLEFVQGEVSRLPTERRASYDTDRSSRVMFLELKRGSTPGPSV